MKKCCCAEKISTCVRTEGPHTVVGAVTLYKLRRRAALASFFILVSYINNMKFLFHIILKKYMKRYALINILYLKKNFQLLKYYLNHQQKMLQPFLWMQCWQT